MGHHVGELDQRIRITRESFASDGGGGRARSLAVLRDTWAKVVPVRGKETVDADAVSNPHLYLFVFRHRPDIPIRVDDLIEWGGEKFNVLFPHKPSSRDEFMEVEAERGVQA